MNGTGGQAVWQHEAGPKKRFLCTKFRPRKRILARIPPFGLYNAETRRPMAGDMQITCSDCGQEFTFSAADQQFFQERGYSTPKRCKPCRVAKKNEQGGSGYRSAPSQGTPVICSGCGQPTTVPFEPRGDRPVYCRDCYTARKGSGGGSRARA
jgi:CxxC-x17-CxxC domain-containing protein